MLARIRILILTCPLLFAGCGPSDGYRLIDGEYVWYNRGDMAGDSTIKMDADEASFQVLDDTQYGKDDKHVFYRGTLIDEADSNSFELFDLKVGWFGKCYAKDNKAVYLKGFVVSEADPTTFQIIDAPYAKDNRQVYCGTVPMHDSDPETFEILRSGTRWVTEFQKDELVRRNGDEFQFLTFPIIVSGGRWAKDRNHHYRDAAIVKDADYDSFHAIDDHYGQDKNGTFRKAFPEAAFLSRLGGAAANRN